MISLNTILLAFGAIVSLSTCGTAFFWGSEPSKPAAPWPVAFYQQRYLQGGPHAYPQLQQSADESRPVQIPAIPIQVPLQAQLAPTPNIHNVQLVPCLCPVSQDFEYDNKVQEHYANQIKN